MQKYQERPIPLIIRRQQDQKYTANPQALEFFASIKGKVAIISVAGVYRTGKSFLLNTMLLNIKKGFAVGPTINPQTKGIWVWGKPLNFKNENNQIINVLVMDSEGLGSTEQDINHDLRLFSITLLLSSAFLYNSVGSIDENAIDSLGLVLRLCQHLKKDRYNDFPDFYWILRDFSLALVNKENAPITTQTYLQNCLSSQPGDSEVRNKIRTSIREAFENRDCFTFVRPLTNESDLQNLDKMNLDELRPEFVDQVIKFRKNIFSRIKVKTIKGKQVKGEMLCDIVNAYVQAINASDQDGKSLPIIENGWNYVCKRQCENAVDELEQLVQQKIKAIIEGQQIPKNKKQLSQQRNAIMKLVQKQFKQRTKNNDQAKDYIDTLNEMIVKKFKKFEGEVKKKNAQEAQIFLRKEFEGIDKRIKQNDFKSMGQLIKEFQIFYEYYRKKCPFKDQVQVGLEFIMKKFSDSALMNHKTMSKQKDSQIETLRNKINQITNQFLSKQEKYKQEKGNLQQKSAKLQSKLEEIMNQNKSLSNKFKTLEQEMQLKVQQAEQNQQKVRHELQMDNLKLKKKILQIQDSFKEIQCQRGQKISRLQRQVLLKNNELQHLNQQKSQNLKRIQDLNKSLSKQKSTKQSLNQQYITELNRQRQEKQTLEKKYQNKINQKQQQIQNLQNHIESKAEETRKKIQELNASRRAQYEQTEQQQKKEIQNLKKELQSLKSQTQKQQHDFELKLRKLQNDASQKEMKIRMQTMDFQKERAILTQKLNFVQKQIQEKNEKYIKLTEQNNYYVGMFEQKQQEINLLSSELQQMRNTNQQNSEQMVIKLNALNEEIIKKERTIESQQKEIQAYKEQVKSKTKQNKSLIEMIQNSETSNTELIKKLRQDNQKLTQETSKLSSNHKQEIESIKQTNRRAIEQQKHSAELSLVQLKNFYEMERQRLQKRLLEQRKKYQEAESQIVQEISSKNKKLQKNYQEQIFELKEKLQEALQNIARSENQYQTKIMNLQQQKDSQKRLLTSRIQTLERKYQESQQELSTNQAQYQEQRINLIKKIEGLNFEVSRKEKEVMQAQSKRDNLQSILAKKDSQLENMKKVMNQQIQFSLNKVSEIQSKYQKLNQEYMNLKIESQKDIALQKQRNQFLNSKLAELSKQKEIGSSKNLDKIDKQKIADLKEVIEKQKAQAMSMQSKLESNRKAIKQLENNHKKQLHAFEKDNQILQQKLEFLEVKNNELQSKVNQRSEYHLKELQQYRNKYQHEKSCLQAEIQNLKTKLVNNDDERSQSTFHLTKDVALLNEKIKFVQYQRDEAKKQLEATNQRLNNMNIQMKKMAEKSAEDNQFKKSTFDKRFTNQLQVMKENMKVRSEQQEETIKRLKDEHKNLKDKISDLQDKLYKAEKIKGVQKNLAEQNQNLRKQKDQLVQNHKGELNREAEQFRKKMQDQQKKIRELERKNSEFNFTIEKQSAKHKLENQRLQQTIRNLEQTLQSEKQKNAQLKNSTISNKKPGLYNSHLANSRDL